MKVSAGWLVATFGSVLLPCGLAGAQETTTPPSTIAPPPAEPTAATPPPAPTEPVSEERGLPGTIKVRFRTNQLGVSFHYAELARPNPDFVPVAWTRLCLAECEVFLGPGPYRFALSSGAGEPVMTPKLVDLRLPQTLEGGYSDRSTRRLAGALILGIGGVASAASMATGIALANEVDRDLGTATLIGGTVGLALSLAIGLPLALAGDEAVLESPK